MIVIVELTQEEIHDALSIAQQRNTGKPQDKQFASEHSSLDIHIMSAMAEVAWERITGWQVDRQWRAAGDAGVDFQANNRTYQIKARDPRGYNNPDLLVRTSHAQADRFVLSEVDMNTGEVKFVGWCTREELTAEKIDLPTKGIRYIRKRKDLRPIPLDIITIT